MKFYFVILLSVLLTIKCYSQQIYKGIDSVNNKYCLELKDSTFTFKIYGPFIKSVKCDGYWSKIEGKLMICNCYEEKDLSNVLASNFMVQRMHVFLPNEDSSFYYFPKDCKTKVLLKQYSGDTTEEKDSD